MAEESKNKLIPTDEVIDAKIVSALEEPLRKLSEHDKSLSSKADSSSVYDKTTVDSKVKVLGDAVAEHVANNTRHITDSEREIWNNKPDSSEIYTRQQSDQKFANVYHEHTSDAWFISVVASKYTKPSGGIPETDMAEDVKTSLGLANTALQKHQDISGKLDKQYGTASIDWNGELDARIQIKNAVLDFYSDTPGAPCGIVIGGNVLYRDEWFLTSTLFIREKIKILPNAQLTFLDDNWNEESIEDRINRISSLANKYSDSSAYTVGQYVFHDGNVYRCTTAIALPGEAWNPAHWSEAQKLDDFFTESNVLLTGTIDARLPYPLYAVPSTGLLKDRAINTTSLASVTVPDNFADLLVRASVASSLSVTMPEAIATKYGDTFPGEAGEYLITITKTGAAEAYVRTIKLEEVA